MQVDNMYHRGVTSLRTRVIAAAHGRFEIIRSGLQLLEVEDFRVVRNLRPAPLLTVRRMSLLWRDVDRAAHSPEMVPQGQVSKSLSQ